MDVLLILSIRLGVAFLSVEFFIMSNIIDLDGSYHHVELGLIKNVVEEM